MSIGEEVILGHMVMRWARATAMLVMKGPPRWFAKAHTLSRSFEARGSLERQKSTVWHLACTKTRKNWWMGELREKSCRQETVS